MQTHAPPDFFFNVFWVLCIMSQTYSSNIIDIHLQWHKPFLYILVNFDPKVHQIDTFSFKINNIILQRSPPPMFHDILLLAPGGSRPKYLQVEKKKTWF